MFKYLNFIVKNLLNLRASNVMKTLYKNIHAIINLIKKKYIQSKKNIEKQYFHI